MDHAQERMLDRHRVVLVKKLDDIELILDILIQHHVLTETLSETIQSKPTRSRQASDLLTTLKRRGPTAYDAFYDALIITNQGYLADLLKPNRAAQRQRAEQQHDNHVYQRPQCAQYETFPQPPVEDELPKEWPDRSRNPVEFNVRTVHTPEMKAYYHSGSADYYTMERNPRGCCLIISNKNFKTLSERHGTQTDVQAMTNLFSQLYFETKIYTDFTVKEMRDLLSKFSQQTDFLSFDALVLVILSHGNSQGIYGIDEDIITTQEITSFFDGGNCPKLSGKPKVFFIQACKGVNKDSGATPGDSVNERCLNVGMENLSVTTPPKCLDELDVEMPDSNRIDKPIPTRADMIVANATTPEQVSWRNPQGTWFIQAVVEVFSRLSYKDDLITLLTKVNNLVASGETKRGYKQVSSIDGCTLTKKVFFFPGLFRDRKLAVQASSEQFV